MRKALVVGIDYYSSVSHLHGCVNDAHSVKSVLERHADGSINFDVKLLSGTGPSDPVPRSQLKDAVKELFLIAEDYDKYKEVMAKKQGVSVDEVIID